MRGFTGLYWVFHRVALMEPMESMGEGLVTTDARCATAICKCVYANESSGRRSRRRGSFSYFFFPKNWVHFFLIFFWRGGGFKERIELDRRLIEVNQNSVAGLIQLEMFFFVYGASLSASAALPVLFFFTGFFFYLDDDLGDPIKTKQKWKKKRNSLALPGSIGFFFFFFFYFCFLFFFFFHFFRFFFNDLWKSAVSAAHRPRGNEKQNKKTKNKKTRAAVGTKQNKKTKDDRPHKRKRFDDNKKETAKKVESRGRLDGAESTRFDDYRVFPSGFITFQRKSITTSCSYRVLPSCTELYRVFHAFSQSILGGFVVESVSFDDYRVFPSATIEFDLKSIMALCSYRVLPSFTELFRIVSSNIIRFYWLLVVASSFTQVYWIELDWPIFN